MKENRYDDQTFFDKYSQMTRSQKGLAGAGEWPELEKLLPDFSGKRVLDLGCGYGWHCRYASDHGAAYVLGTDLSQRMLEQARTRHSGPGIEYRQAAMEDLQFPEGSFDAVISSLAFHYVRDFRPLAERIGRWLVPGGSFVFSVEHPVFTAYGSQDWYYDENGNILHFPVDNYYLEGRRDAVFLGERVVKYHRTLTSYLDTLLQSGFTLRRLVEPKPPEELMDLPPIRPAEEPAKVPAETPPEAPAEECYVNVMQLLVEEKAEKYMQMFGVCCCERCQLDVKAFALNHLPPKYVFMGPDERVPRLTVYEAQYSSDITAQLLKACTIVHETPHHTRPSL